MKKNYLAMLLIGQLAFLTNSYAQNIAINGTGSLPDTSAMLDVSSTNKGFLAPRMTTAEQNAIPLPAKGLLVFNTTDNVFNVNTGTPGSPTWTALVTGSGAGISSINGLTVTTQTYATGTSGTNFAISSSGSTHTFNLPDAATGSRGLVSTGTQTFEGDKTFIGTITASTLASGAATDSIVTADATGLLRKRTVSSVVAGNVWVTAGNSPVNSGNQFLGSINNASLRFRTHNLERMVLDSMGNLGLGTAAPLKPIDIVRSLPGQGGLMQFRNTAANGWTSIDLQNELGTQVGNIGWGNTSASTYSNSFYFATNVASPIFFATNNDERMRILSTGNIGVGTATPASSFEVAGSLGTSLSMNLGNGAAVTLDNTAVVWVFTGNKNVVLPAASTCANRRYVIVNRSNAAKTISTYVNFLGANATTFPANSSIEVISDGTSWLLIKN